MDSINEYFYAETPYENLDVIRVIGNKPRITRDNLKPLMTPDNFTFKMSKWQGSSQEGIEGLVRLLAIEIVIESTRNWMLEHHKEWTVKAVRNFVVNQESVFHEEAGSSAIFTCNNGSIEKLARDQVQIRHERNFEKEQGKNAIIEVDFIVKKFQGKLEGGLEGFMRILALREGLKSAITYSAKYYPESFKEASDILNTHAPSRNKAIEHMVEVDLAS